MKLNYLTAAAAIGMLAPLQSQAMTILSDSFPTASSGMVTGWTETGDNLFGGIGVEANANHPGGVGSGNWAYFQTNNTSSAGMFQSTGVGGTIGDMIAVNFDLGGNAGGNLYTGQFTVSLWDGSPTGGGNQLNSLVAPDPASGTSSPITLSTTLTSNTTGNLFVQFNASNTSAGNGGNGAFNQAIIDNVLVTQVPEPSAALLGAFGALALLRRRRA